MLSIQNQPDLKPLAQAVDHGFLTGNRLERNRLVAVAGRAEIDGPAIGAAGQQDRIARPHAIGRVLERLPRGLPGEAVVLVPAVGGHVIRSCERAWCAVVKLTAAHGRSGNLERRPGPRSG